MSETNLERAYREAHIPQTVPFYPARPVNGGPLEKALPKTGEWYYEPKVNGWRTLVHTPTGTMFNRHGQRLSIEPEFKVVLDELRVASDFGLGSEFEWLDCEAFSRRHPLGKGSLILLDVPLLKGDYLERNHGPCSPPFTAWHHEQFPPPTDTLLRFSYIYEPRETQEISYNRVIASAAAERLNGEAFRHKVLTEESKGVTLDDEITPLAAWTRLQAVNKALGCDLFEGLVAKRADSPYPKQLRSPDVEFPFWVKHRWAF